MTHRFLVLESPIAIARARLERGDFVVAQPDHADCLLVGHYASPDGELAILRQLRQMGVVNGGGGLTLSDLEKRLRLRHGQTELGAQHPLRLSRGRQRQRA